MQNFINEWENKTFEWGVIDCYTFVRAYIDLKFPENKLPKLEYKSLKEAIELNKKFKWIEEIKKCFKFEIIDSDFQDGDLLLVEDDNMQCAHLVFDNKIYSFDKYLNCVKIDITLVKPQKMIRLIGQI